MTIALPAQSQEGTAYLMQITNHKEIQPAMISRNLSPLTLPTHSVVCTMKDLI